jgi:hypothetical protein
LKEGIDNPNPPRVSSSKLQQINLKHQQTCKTNHPRSILGHKPSSTSERIHLQENHISESPQKDKFHAQERVEILRERWQSLNDEL